MSIPKLLNFLRNLGPLLWLEHKRLKLCGWILKDSMKMPKLKQFIPALEYIVMMHHLEFPLPLPLLRAKATVDDMQQKVESLYDDFAKQHASLKVGESTDANSLLDRQ